MVENRYRGIYTWWNIDMEGYNMVEYRYGGTYTWWNIDMGRYVHGGI